jgi:DNA repair exonuclease SbcCD nuclease subunit
MRDSILFIGDPHLDSRTPVSRSDDYRATTITKLRSLLTLAINRGSRAVVATGDMFHRYDVPISYLNEVIQVLKEFKEAGIDFYSIIGNHDLPHNVMDYFKNTPLALLFKSGLVKHLTTGSSILLKNSIITGLDFTEDIEVHNDLKELFPDLVRILVMHYATENTVPGDNVSTAQLNQFHKVVAGHDHSYYPPLFKDNVRVYRPGSFTRRTKDEHNLTRNIKIYEYKDHNQSMTELVLPNLDPAANIFREKVFTVNLENLYNNSYSKFFSDLSEDKEYTSIVEILEDMPPEVNKESIDAIFNYLKAEGVNVQKPKPTAKSENFEEMFSE